MWTILKFNKKEYYFLKKDFKEKLGHDVILYAPKILIEKKNQNKVFKREFYILGDYIFLYHKKINLITLNNLKFSRGLKYFLEGFQSSQNEIETFINKCKSLENEKGFVSQNLFEIIKNERYKFLTGPFTSEIFKILEIQKNKINILIGNFNTYIKKKDYLFFPIKN